MAKTFLVTVAVEIDDDVPEPDHWDWSGLEGTIPGLSKMDLVSVEKVIHLPNADDPASATVH